MRSGDVLVVGLLAWLLWPRSPEGHGTVDFTWSPVTSPLPPVIPPDNRTTIVEPVIVDDPMLLNWGWGLTLDDLNNTSE